MNANEVSNLLIQNKYSLHEPSNKPNKTNNNKKKRKNKRKKRKSKFKSFLKKIIVLIILMIIFIFLFFKTTLFEEYKELWVQTAMSTMNHQWLAKLFLSDKEIEEIMKKLKVNNDENSDSSNIKITNKSNDINVETIKGKNYVGHVMTIGDPSRVQLVDTRGKTRGTKLSETVKKYNAKAGINAGGFADEGGTGSGNKLVNAFILNQKLLNGNTTKTYSLIGLSKEGKLILGNYKYNDGIKAGINSAVEFGPFIIVNRKKSDKEFKFWRNSASYGNRTKERWNNDICCNRWKKARI